MDVPRTTAGVAGISAIALGLLTVTGPTVPDENWGTRGAAVNALGLVTFAALAVAVELLPRFVGLGRVGRADTGGQSREGDAEQGGQRGQQ